jgi:hypothetical protein
VLVRSLLEYELTIDEKILVSDVLCLAYLMYRLLDYTVELTVADSDVVYSVRERVGLVANDHDAVLRLLTGDILHQHVAYDRIVSATAYLLWLVVGVDLQHCLVTLTYGNVTHVDVLDDTTTARVGLYAKHTLQLRRVHHTIVSIYVLATARDLRTNYHTAMSVLHLAVADDYVL